jgi:hypothetical protein
MNALPPWPSAHAAGSAVGNDFARRLAGLGPGALRLLLQALRERLGTPAEQAGDVERVHLLDREINHRRPWSPLS